MSTISALLPDFAQQQVDANGAPLAGAKLYTFEAGTMTPLATYSNTTRVTANANPVVADSAGRWGPIFIKPQAYYLELYDANDVLVTTRDNVVDLGSLVYANLPTAPGMSALTSLLVGLFCDPTLATPISVDGAYITTAAATLYTVPASTIAMVQRVTMWNADTVVNDGQIAIVPSGGSVTAAYKITAQGTISSTQTVIIDGPWFLQAGDFVSAVSSTATGTDLSVRLDVAELPAQLVGVTLQFDDGSLLTNAFATYYTATAKSICYAITLCNTDTSDRVVSVALIQQGGSVVNSKQIFGSSIAAGQTVIIGGPFVLDTGDFFQAKAATGSVVSFKVTTFQLS